MPDRIVDMEIDTEVAEALDRIASVPNEDLRGLFAASGLDVVPILEFLKDMSRGERMMVLHALAEGVDSVDIDPDVIAFEAEMIGRGLQSLTILQRRLLALAEKLPPSEAREALDLTQGMTTSTDATRTGAVLVLARLARLAGVAHGGFLRIGARLEVGRPDSEALRKETVLARNIAKAGPAPDVLVAPSRSSGFTSELLRPLIQTLGEWLPAEAVRFIEPPALRGYGVTFVQSLTIWLPNEDPASELSARIVGGVRDWIQTYHDANPRRPKQVTFISSLGRSLRVLKWESDIAAVQDTVVEGTGEWFSERPDE